VFKIDLSALEPGVHHITREGDVDALKRTPAEKEATKKTDDDSAGAESGDASGDAPASAADNPVADEVTFGPVQLDAVLNYQPDHALVTFEARTVATLTCDRTLRRFEQPIDGGYAVLFAAPGRGTPEQSEEHDELRELARGARFLDLIDAVRDTLLLAVPQRKVAPDAEDEDIDTVFGAPAASEDEPVDPRWEKLRQLRSDETSS
jgi:uncharacterized protein